nr:hypothetical protein BCU42_03315 [Vibrio splendidus]
MLGRKYWQQAAGDSDRNYADICLKWDVILNGPGYAGAFPSCVEMLRNDDWSSRKITDLKRFAVGISSGDIVVLRLGTATVVGVGVVVGDYEWSELFDDVDGWDLQHVRRVKWLWKGVESPKVFPTYTLKQGDTTQELSSLVVKEWVSSLNLDFENHDLLKMMPLHNVEKVDFEHISEALYDYGVANASIEALGKEIDELIRIAKWYQKFENPSEFETVAYLAVPMLRALGWTPQKMAIEWNHVDVALFQKLPRNNEHLAVVVEAKKKGNSCLTALSQAQAYAEGRGNCQRLIVTDGLRYGVFIKKEGSFELYAYFNITDLKSYYPIHECFGVSEALIAMTPEWSY